MPRVNFGRKALIRILLLAILGVVLLVSPELVTADSSLTITPLTWNVIGLDSNNPNVGPNNFPVGVRACNPGTSTTDVNDIRTISRYAFGLDYGYINVKVALF